MQAKLIGPAVGVGLSIVCSGLGVLVASFLGGDVAMSATLVHAAAAVVLLVTILSRLESQES